MGLGTNQFTATDVAVFKPEIWTEKLNDFYKARLVAAKFFLDMSEDAVGGGDVLHLPNLTEMATNTKGNGSQVTLISPTETSIDLTISTWEETSFLVEDLERAQVKRSYNLQERYISNAGYSVGKSYDADILGLYSGLSNSVNDSASAVTDAIIRSSIQTLDEGDIPMEDRGFFFYPSIVWGDLMGIDKFTLLNQAGQSPLAQGMVASLYAIPVYSTTQVVITNTDFVHNLLAHREAFAHASQGVNGPGIRLQSSYIQEYLGELSTADGIWGVIENRDAAAVEIQAIK